MTDLMRLRRVEHTKRAAAFAYAQMYDRHAELVQLYVGIGRHDMAEAARLNAAIAFRAWQAEDRERVRVP